MKYKIFAVSDVHGHYTELKWALDRAGFDENDETHIFLSCGDLFDRGKENASVYRFVKGLKRKILIRGNHEDMLCDVLKRGFLEDFEISNGTDLTVRELLGMAREAESREFDVESYDGTIREIIAFADSMCHYFETEHYVFTHGWLPLVFEGQKPCIDPLWREASPSDWEIAHQLEWQQTYNVRAMLDGKTIVCGHRPASLGHLFDDTRDLNCYEPFFGEGIVAIDSGTVRSGEVYVVIIEENICIDE
jgi:serine/threonine protein phosphatase 1